MKRRFFAATVALALLAPAAPAVAGDVESWNWFEVRVPVSEGQFGLPDSLRLVTDSRYGGRYANGLGQLFFRVGPIWELHPNMFLGLHYTTYANQFDPASAPGDYEIVHRAEVEPNIRWRWGDFAFNDRNRFEYAASGRTSFFRYRNQLRANYQPIGHSGWFPYVWDEVMVPFNAGFNQNRASVGLAFPLAPDMRLDTGYVLRSRTVAGGAWDHDHVVNLSLFYAPKSQPMVPATSAD